MPCLYATFSERRRPRGAISNISIRVRRRCVSPDSASRVAGAEPQLDAFVVLGLPCFVPSGDIFESGMALLAQESHGPSDKHNSGSPPPRSFFFLLSFGPLLSNRMPILHRSTGAGVLYRTGVSVVKWTDHVTANAEMQLRMRKASPGMPSMPGCSGRPG